MSSYPEQKVAVDRPDPLQNYKKKPIQMYNPHKAPLLDHYR
jgi:hypothetical protein